MKLKWSVPEYRNHVTKRLGGLHTRMCFQGRISDHVEENGMKDIWVKAGVTGPLKAEEILCRMSYKAAMRLHKLTWQALWRILIPQILEFCKQFGRNLYDELTALSNGENLLPLITHCKLEDIQNDLYNIATKDLATAAIKESLLSQVHNTAPHCARGSRQASCLLQLMTV
jgi:hypothetical protein